MFYYLRAWIGYLDISFLDVLLFLVLGLLFVFGIYILVKKNVAHGLAQILLTLFSPEIICTFIANKRDPSGYSQTKMWLEMFESNYDINITVVAMIMMITILMWIVVTVKNISLLKKQ